MRKLKKSNKTVNVGKDYTNNFLVCQNDFLILHILPLS